MCVCCVRVAFKRSSLAASEKQDNVLSRSSRVPHPRVNRLPSPHRLRAHATPTVRPIGRAGKAEWGKSRLLPQGRTCGPSGCESIESLPRQTSRRTDVFLVYPELSRDLVSLRILVFSFFRPLYARRSNTRVWYIAPKRTVRVASRRCYHRSWNYRAWSRSCRSDLRDTSRDRFLARYSDP